MTTDWGADASEQTRTSVPRLWTSLMSNVAKISAERVENRESHPQEYSICASFAT